MRVITGMKPDEFADAIGAEVGWPVPLFVYLEWEKDGGAAPPADVLDAARALSRRTPVGPADVSLNRRQFLGGVVGFSSLAPSLSLRWPSLPTAPKAGAVRPKWRISQETATDLETLVGSYRRAYAERTAVPDLLPCASGMLDLLLDMARRGQWPASSTPRLASLVGQAAVLTGLLHLMGRHDLDAARAHYTLALQAAREAEDWDLASYVLGSLAFHAVSAQRLADGRVIADAAWELASDRATARTSAWVAALASELCARQGDESTSQRFITESYLAIRGAQHERSWKGVGWFDEARIIAYEGGNMLLLGRYEPAEEHLRQALDRLQPARLKHRSTLSADLAMVLLHRSEVDEAAPVRMTL